MQTGFLGWKYVWPLCLECNSKEPSSNQNKVWGSKQNQKVQVTSTILNKRHLPGSSYACCWRVLSLTYQFGRVLHRGTNMSLSVLKDFQYFVCLLPGLTSLVIGDRHLTPPFCNNFLLLGWYQTTIVICRRSTRGVDPPSHVEQNN